MSDDRLHDLAAGDEFIDLHFPFARDSLLDDDLLILPEASIVPLIIVDRHRLLAEDLPRGIRNDVDLHAFLHLHQTVFDRHHLLPVEARVIHHALHGLLRGIDDLFLAIRDDGNRHCPLHHDNCAVRDVLRACPECVIRLQRYIEIAQYILEIGGCRRNDLLVSPIIYCNSLRRTCAQKIQRCCRKIHLASQGSRRQYTC